MAQELQGALVPYFYALITFVILGIYVMYKAYNKFT